MTKPRNRILIADTHRTMTAGVRLLLTDLCNVLVMVADAQSLSDAVVHSDFDLIMDLSIPRKSGDNIVHLLRRLRADQRLIVLSVHDETMAVEECMAAGALGFALKCSAVNDLIPAVESVMRGETYVSPSIRKGA